MVCDIKIHIRHAQTSDTPAINVLLSQIVQVHHATRPDIFRPSYMNEGVNYSVEETDAPVFVAVNEDECVVGCLWCLISHERNNSLKINRDWLVIDDICVDEKYRGNGIGTKLVDFARKLALEKGLDKIELNVYEDNRNALRFYKHLGFKTQKRVMELNVSTLISPDKETDQERQARIYPIVLSEYNSAWPQWFVEEKIKLEQLIGKDNIARISHYGSTSVPGLMAKPTIDILLEIKEKTDVDKLIEALSLPDYICLSGAGLTMPTPPPHLIFLKGYLSDGFAEKVYHIHVRYPNDWDELHFRDYLILYPEAALEYAKLKKRLFKYYEHDRDGYTGAKSSFIKEITEKARKEIVI